MSLIPEITPRRFAFIPNLPSTALYLLLAQAISPTLSFPHFSQIILHIGAVTFWPSMYNRVLFVIEENVKNWMLLGLLVKCRFPL